MNCTVMSGLTLVWKQIGPTTWYGTQRKRLSRHRWGFTVDQIIDCWRFVSTEVKTKPHHGRALQLHACRRVASLYRALSVPANYEHDMAWRFNFFIASRALPYEIKDRVAWSITFLTSTSLASVSRFPSCLQLLRFHGHVRSFWWSSNC